MIWDYPEPIETLIRPDYWDTEQPDTDYEEYRERELWPDDE